jgi:hypothetical protein
MLYSYTGIGPSLATCFPLRSAGGRPGASGMLIEPLKAFLFGEVQKVDIHCCSETIGRRLRERVSADLGGVDQSVPVSIMPAGDVDYALVHYTAGLLRPAHADVMVLEARRT